MTPRASFIERQRSCEIVTQGEKVFGWPDVGDRQRGKFIAAVAVVTNRRLVHGKKFERFCVEDPHRHGTALEQDAIARLGRAQVALRATMRLSVFRFAKLTFDRRSQPEELVFRDEIESAR